MLRTAASSLALWALMMGCGPTVRPHPPSPRRPAPVPVAAVHASVESPATLAAFVDSVLASPGQRYATWGIVILDPSSGDTILSRNANKNLVPASSLKVITSSVALTTLGADYRYRTSFIATGPIRDSVLQGDLLVAGTGDPTISDRMRGNAFQFLAGLADSLPFRTIQGTIRSARNTFPDPPYGLGWAWDDLTESYAAGVDELLFNEGVPLSNDPSTTFLQQLTTALGTRGIRTENQPVTSTRSDTVFTLSSPPLRDIFPALLKPSQNQIAEVLLKTLGFERTGVGTADSGRVVIARQLEQWRIPTGTYLIRDGSGLSRNNLLTAATLAQVLTIMRTDTLFVNALPIAGVDGTLRNRFVGTVAAGNVRAKTGYLESVRALGGYLTTVVGRHLVFAIITNNATVPAREVAAVQDSIVIRLINLP